MSQLPDQEAPRAAESLSYSAAAGAFDEMAEAPGRPRPHWRPLMAALQQLGPEELQARWQDGRRLIREHGVTYTVYGDPKGMDRPWGLDLVPLLITAEEWTRLEAGLFQRSRLLNLILTDIYAGTQRLLRDGFIPAELVYANPAFLRPCRGIRVRGDAYLHLHACDLGRSPCGQWWVLSDRTEAPGGAGYAWENRTVLSRLLPEEIRQCQVQPVSSFFQQQRDLLCDLAPSGARNPNVVLLSPGPLNEIYFEHAYLARHLGFALVEGADMTVRDRRVFLKTVEGLQPVDVIVRRVDDAFCDPLELRGDSFLGVSGMVDATRAGHVTVANALGAGLMETPAFLAFLPNLCRHLLGEDLLLPSVATWWCGQPEALRYVMAHLDSLVLKPAFGSQRGLPQVVPESPQTHTQAAAERGRLKDRIRAAPHRFVAQERVQLSQAPAWVDRQLTPRSVVVRAFVANGGDSIAVLPGALTRVSNNGDELGVSVQSGGGSKDTWVLPDGSGQHPDPAPLAPASRPVEHVIRGVPSRAADHLFWLGRYTERLEQMLRILRCVLARISGEPGRLAERSGLEGLALNLGLLPSSPSVEGDRHEIARRLLTLLYEPAEPGGVRELVDQIRSTALAVRDRFSGDTWRILGRLDQDAAGVRGRLALAGATALIHTLVLDLAAFNGMEMENMTRGWGWRFLDLGRRLERGLSMVRLLEATASLGAQATFVLEPVLEIADSVMTYRRLYFDRPRLPGVLEVLLCDATNPRALAFQVHGLSQHAAALANEANSSGPAAEQMRVTALDRSLRSIDLNRLAAAHSEGRPEPLLDLLNSWATELAALSDQVTNRYFSHSFPRTS